MSCQHSLRFDEDFRADCRESALPDGAFELTRCSDCGHLWPVTDLHFGLCSDCAGPFDEEEKEN